MALQARFADAPPPHHLVLNLDDELPATYASCSDLTEDDKVDKAAGGTYTSHRFTPDVQPINGRATLTVKADNGSSSTNHRVIFEIVPDTGDPEDSESVALDVPADGSGQASLDLSFKQADAVTIGCHISFGNHGFIVYTEFAYEIKAVPSG